MNKQKEYNENTIKILEGLEGVRMRPGMYIGGTDKKALHHMVYEIVDNSIDEALSGHCDDVVVIIEKDGSISISDNGRGIPVGLHPTYKRPTLELIVTVLHSGGKFDKDGYSVSGGLHGVGLSVVNALSEKMEIQVKRDKKIYKLELAYGKVVNEMKEIGTTNETGTYVRFYPDKTIFEDTDFDFDYLEQRFKEIAFLNPNITLNFYDKRGKDDKKVSFKFTGGLISFIEEINKDYEKIQPDIIYFKGVKDDIVVECAMQYTEEYSETMLSFANNIKVSEGGTHIVGFKTALSKVINEVSRKKNILKDKDSNLSGDEVREGLTAVISLKLQNPEFDGQTKSKLTNSEVKGIVESIVYEFLSDYFIHNTNILNTIVNKAKDALRAKEAAKKSREISKKKTGLDLSGIAGKVATCTSKNPIECEIYIVEGKSAGGNAKTARNRSTQAILPLRGKILNCEKSKLTKILLNEEIRAMISSFGTGIGKNFNIDNLKFHKIIIMTDADVDGAHITTLLLTFFYRFMRPLIDNGHIYLARPPLYKISKGKKFEYAYTDKEKDQIIKKMGENLSIQRYKGLGEMDAEQLWETTMNPECRILTRVTADDILTANNIFTVLMGKEVEPRRKFIETNAKYADIDNGNG